MIVCLCESVCEWYHVNSKVVRVKNNNNKYHNINIIQNIFFDLV